MRAVFLFVALYTVYTASAVPLTKFAQEEYSRFIRFPDGDGKYHLVDLEEEPDYQLLSEIEKNPANNLYLLYTRDNDKSSQTLVMNNADSIRNSHFNPKASTLVIAHGWLSNQNSDINPEIRDAYLGKNDGNVIVVDWRRLAISTYPTAVSGVPAVGRGLGQFINFLCQTTGATLDSFHIVGFSLGAHLAGNAGRYLNGRVARVTGLDPAGPLWHYNSDRINRDDGVYVEAIHTDGGLSGLGIGKDVANVDFYPNGGTNQPGCVTGLCDHNRAWEFFIATITHNHLIGNECSSDLQVSMNSCRGAQFPMGNDNLRKTGSGKYRLNTGRRYPF